MPEGCSPAQGILMAVMKEIFEDFEEWMIVIFDNMLILAHDYDDAFNKLELVLNRAYERGLVLKMAKSWFGYTKANIFGYEVEYGKYQLGNELKAAIQKMELPRKTKDMQSFLGSVLFFKDFIPNFAEYAAPLHDMTQEF